MTARRSVTRVARAVLPALVLAGVWSTSAEAQLLDRILDRAEEAKATADKYGAAVIPISTAQEIELGRGIAATVAGHYTVLRDPALTEYVNLVGTAVAAIDPRPDVGYRFAVLDSDEVNAFAAPGGYVFVTRGALALMTDEATLAGVLAHEVGHVNARDVVSEIQSRARTTIGIQEASDRVDITGEAYLRAAVEAGANALFMGLSREDELEADAYAIRTTAAAGYDPAGLERFVAALDRAPQVHVSLLEKTHPDEDDRLEAIERAIRGLPAADREGVTAADRFAARVGAAGAAPGR